MSAFWCNLLFLCIKCRRAAALRSSPARFAGLVHLVEDGLYRDVDLIESERGSALREQILGSDMSLRDMEKLVLRKAVARCKGSLCGAARLLGMTRPQPS